MIKENNEEILKILDKYIDKDFIENITPDNIKDFTADELKSILRNTVSITQAKEETLRKTNDTYLGMSLKDFTNILNREGFEKQSEWEYTTSNNSEIAEIYTKGGMILFATSTGNGKIVNDATLYVQAQMKEGLTLSNLYSTKSAGYFDIENMKVSFCCNAKEGLVNVLHEIEEKCNVISILEDINQSIPLITNEDKKEYREHWEEYDRLTKERMMTSNKVNAICSAITGKPFVLESNTYKNNDISTITISGNVTKIKAGAFKDCKNLKEVVIKSDVHVPVSAFINCPNLEKVVVQGVILDIKNGKIKDNSLTGLIDSFKTTENTPNKLSRLKKLLKKCEEANRNDMIDALTKLKDEVLNGATFIGLVVPGLVNIGSSYLSGNLHIYEYNGDIDTDSNKKDIEDIIDEVILGVKNGKISEMTVKLEQDIHKEHKIETEQYNLIKKGINTLENKMHEQNTIEEIAI